MTKYYRLYSASGQALTSYVRKKKDATMAKKYFQKFKKYKRMKIKVYYSSQKP